MGITSQVLVLLYLFIEKFYFTILKDNFPTCFLGSSLNSHQNLMKKSMRKLFTIFVTGFIFGNSFAQTLILEDPLTNQTTKGTIVNNMEGSDTHTFTSEGYMPNAGGHNMNHILYELPGSTPAKEGYLELEFKGMKNPPNADADPAFIGMYDGRGITEPIVYFDDFKNNFYRWNVHFRGDNKVIKAVINCAAPTAERLNATKSVFPGTRDWYSEPNGTSQIWDSNKWYKLKVEWKNKNFKVFLDGKQVWGTAGPYDYAPVIHRLWLGCAPGYAWKYTASIEGLTFRNLKVYSYSPITSLVESYTTETFVGPNPVENILTIENPLHEIVSISLKDISGRIIRTEEVSLSNTAYINVEDLSPGIYMADINFKEGKITKKIIKR